jgi:glycosyltransferase involved in cell wall biosynthesis
VNEQIDGRPSGPDERFAPHSLATPRAALTAGPVELSVVLPCLNEAETLAVCVRTAYKALDDHRISGEVVVADNGSTDGSQAIASQLGARVVDVAEKGYGSALRGGIAVARGTYVLMGDADASYDFSEIPRFLDELRQGHDLVMGNRFRGGIKPGAMPPLHRYFGSPVLTFIGRCLFGSPCGDFHCGIRAFRTDKVLRLDLRTTGMEFASELVVKATLFGLRITEVPATLSPDGRSRPPHLRSWRDGWRHLRFMLLFSPNWLFLYPGLALMLVGLTALAVLLPRTLFVGHVGFGVHTLLYAATAVLIGFQAVLFSALTKAFTISTGLMPDTGPWNRLVRGFSLEAGVLTGVLLAVAGLLGAVIAVWIWSDRGFGDLDADWTLRIVIPSAIAMALGSQIVLSSLFLSVLGLRHK